MVSYYTKRIGQAAFTYYVAATFAFVLIRFLPGGPMAYLKAQIIEQGTTTNPEVINRIVESYINVRPDEPIWIQYVDYMSALAQLDLGTSIWFRQPVADILLNALPWTFFLMTQAMLLRFVLGISLGAVMAYKEGSRFDYAATIVGFLLSSIPYYIAAIFFIAGLAYVFPIFPTGGRVNYSLEAGFNPEFIWSVFYHSALPVLSLVVTGIGGRAIGMRANSVRVLGEDYLRVARLRGLGQVRIALRYVARNAVLPMYTGQMIAIGALFGGSVILETIFSYPGVGYYTFRGVVARDYPLMMGGFLMITAAVLIGILIADLTYSKIDPRAKGGASREAY